MEGIMMRGTLQYWHSTQPIWQPVICRLCAVPASLHTVLRLGDEGAQQAFEGRLGGLCIMWQRWGGERHACLEGIPLRHMCATRARAACCQCNHSYSRNHGYQPV